MRRHTRRATVRGSIVSTLSGIALLCGCTSESGTGPNQPNGLGGMGAAAGGASAPAGAGAAGAGVAGAGVAGAGGGLAAGNGAVGGMGAGGAGAAGAGVAGAGVAGAGVAGTGVAGAGVAGAGVAGAGVAGAGVAGTGAAGTGVAGTGAAGAGGGGVGSFNPTEIDPVGNANRAPGFVDLTPPMGAPLPMQGDTVAVTPPAGWSWYAIEGTVCRDGSQTGFYVHRGTADGLLIYLEGGGACSNLQYCAFNPMNVDQVLAGDGQIVLGSALGAGPGRQQPGAYTDASHVALPAGIFDTSNAQNPFKDWSQIYIPYCTGDVHFGTKESGTVPNLTTPQKFVGYRNMQRFVGRIVPTFRDAVSQVVIAGASAGGFGAALNFSMVQDAFGDIPVKVLDDSGPPFDDQYMPTCMQKRWRETWGFNDAFPPDCDECRQADGAGMVHLSDFLLRKHPSASIAIISSMQDEVIRLFYSVGLQDCLNYDTADPVLVTLLQGDPLTYFPAQQYTDGLNDLRATYSSTGQLATYFMADVNLTFHQHIFRPRFYEAAAGGKTIAQFVTDFLNGTNGTVGP